MGNGDDDGQSRWSSRAVDHSFFGATLSALRNGIYRSFRVMNPYTDLQFTNFGHPSKAIQEHKLHADSPS